MMHGTLHYCTQEQQGGTIRKREGRRRAGGTRERGEGEGGGSPLGLLVVVQ
jgi:hypothetical protein